MVARIAVGGDRRSSSGKVDVAGGALGHHWPVLACVALDLVKGPTSQFLWVDSDQVQLVLVLFRNSRN
jgi:hypothetical protein